MFGDVVKQHRIERGWTQEQLAEITGLTGPMISMLESNLRGSRPSYETLAAFAAAFGMTVEELRAAANTTTPFPYDELRANGLEEDVANWFVTLWDQTESNAERAALRVKAKKLAQITKQAEEIKQSIGFHDEKIKQMANFRQDVATMNPENLSTLVTKLAAYRELQTFRRDLNANTAILPNEDIAKIATSAANTVNGQLIVEIICDLHELSTQPESDYEEEK
jgi:transcriptional regulator with XRE-family HTH domain